jgi:hypothetical protein
MATQQTTQQEIATLLAKPLTLGTERRILNLLAFQGVTNIRPADKERTVTTWK